jgi:hypothetical protein
MALTASEHVMDREWLIGAPAEVLPKCVAVPVVKPPPRRTIKSGPRRELDEAVQNLFGLPTAERALAKGVSREEWLRMVWRPAIWLVGIHHAAYKHGWDSPEMREAWAIYVGLLNSEVSWPRTQN